MLSLALFLATSAFAVDSAPVSSATLTVDGGATTAVLEGKICFGKKTCDTYWLNLNADGSFSDSQHRAGTYTLREVRDGTRTLALDFGVLGTQGIPEDGLNCWTDAVSPINPALGQINTCLSIELQQQDNYDPTCAANIDVLSPLPSENGHWSVGRMTPDSAGGMWVHRLDYHVQTANQDNCGPIDHEFQVFIGDANLPPSNTPTVLYTGLVDASAFIAGSNRIAVELPNPVFVAADESIFLAVEMLLGRTDAMCQFSCGSQVVPDMGYWSNAVSTPYSWQDLNDWGIGTPMITAHGLYAAP